MDEPLHSLVMISSWVRGRKLADEGPALKQVRVLCASVRMLCDCLLAWLCQLCVFVALCVLVGVCVCVCVGWCVHALCA